MHTRTHSQLYTLCGFLSVFTFANHAEFSRGLFLRACVLSYLHQRWVLEQPGVASVVVGMRNAKNVKDNAMAFSFELSPEDSAEIDAVLQKATPSQGGVYHRERGI